MTALYEYVRKVKTREREELLNLQDNAGTKTNGYKLPMNKCRLEDF